MSPEQGALHPGYPVFPELGVPVGEAGGWSRSRCSVGLSALRSYWFSYLL